MKDDSQLELNIVVRTKITLWDAIKMRIAGRAMTGLIDRINAGFDDEKPSQIPVKGEVQC